MNIQEKASLLEGMYHIYDTILRSRPLACRPHCADCCTCNMTLTTLEAFWMMSNLDSASTQNVVTAVRAAAGGRRFQPALTFNEIARRCLNQENVPEESPNPDWGTCPLLAEDTCPVYALRPFGCRCMVSRIPCAAGGYADMDDFLLTVNHLFLQYIEHIDTPGLTGNLVDVLLFLESEENRRAYGSGRIAAPSGRLSPNRRIPVLMIPPRHRARVQPILSDLNRLLG